MLDTAFSALEAADSIFGRIVTFGNQQNVSLDRGQLLYEVEALGTNTQFNFSPTTELGKETRLVIPITMPQSWVWQNAGIRVTKSG